MQYISANAVGDDCQFVRTYSPFSITVDNIDQIVMLSGNNTLGYSKNARTLRSCRAHFVVPTTTTDNAPTMTRYAINFSDNESTGITTTNYTNYTNSDERKYKESIYEAKHASSHAETSYTAPGRQQKRSVAQRQR